MLCSRNKCTVKVPPFSNGNTFQWASALKLTSQTVSKWCFKSVTSHFTKLLTFVISTMASMIKNRSNANVNLPGYPSGWKHGDVVVNGCRHKNVTSICRRFICKLRVNTIFWYLSFWHLRPVYRECTVWKVCAEANRIHCCKPDN